MRGGKCYKCNLNFINTNWNLKKDKQLSLFLFSQKCPLMTINNPINLQNSQRKQSVINPISKK